MLLTRWIISTRQTEVDPVREADVNTLYFNVSGGIENVDWTSLGNDLWTLWSARPWAVGRFVDVRGYDMSDPEPREQRYIKRLVAPGSASVPGAPQVALALSYYADRNLPRQRGRIFLGPWQPTTRSATTTQTDQVIALAPLLAGLAGLNVDWSLWSPTTQQHTRINHAWVDDSWDIIRSRKYPAQAPRKLWNGNG